MTYFDKVVLLEFLEILLMFSWFFQHERDKILILQQFTVESSFYIFVLEIAEFLIWRILFLFVDGTDTEFFQNQITQPFFTITQKLNFQWWHKLEERSTMFCFWLCLNRILKPIFTNIIRKIWTIAFDLWNSSQKHSELNYVPKIFCCFILR